MPSRDDLTQRQISRHTRKVAGDHSSRMARDLMKLAGTMLGKLEMAPALYDAVVQARSITSQIARRRAERALAGTLRGEDLDALRVKLENVLATGAAEPDRLHRAERWRTRFMEEGLSVIAEFPPGDPDDELPRLIAAAQRERTSGKPPGAGRALFRHIAEALKVHDDTAGDDDGDAADDDDEP